MFSTQLLQLPSGFLCLIPFSSYSSQLRTTGVPVLNLLLSITQVLTIPTPHETIMLSHSSAQQPCGTAHSYSVFIDRALKLRGRSYDSGSWVRHHLNPVLPRSRISNVPLYLLIHISLPYPPQDHTRKCSWSSLL